MRHLVCLSLCHEKEADFLRVLELCGFSALGADACLGKTKGMPEADEGFL